MTLGESLTILDRLPAVVADLRAILAANAELSEIGYAGTDALGFDLSNALEALDGPAAALQFLEGLRYAKGDPTVYRQWDAALSARMTLGEYA